MGVEFVTLRETTLVFWNLFMKVICFCIDKWLWREWDSTSWCHRDSTSWWRHWDSTSWRKSKKSSFPAYHDKWQNVWQSETPPRTRKGGVSLQTNFNVSSILGVFIYWCVFLILWRQSIHIILPVFVFKNNFWRFGPSL